MANPNSTTTTVYGFGGGSPAQLSSPVELGASATDKIGAYGATAVVQAAVFTAVSTTALVIVSGTTVYGFATGAQADLLFADVNAMRTILINLGFMAAS